MEDGPTAYDYVRVRANLDGNGQMPVQGHHVAHRSLRPDLVSDIRNHTGVGVDTHVDHHDHGEPIPERPTLRTIW